MYEIETALSHSCPIDALRLFRGLIQVFDIFSILPTNNILTASHIAYCPKEEDSKNKVGHLYFQTVVNIALVNK
jgi:hypothetical protein